MAATYGIPEDAYTPVETSWGAVKMWTEKTERGWAVIQIPACRPWCGPIRFKCKVKGKLVELIQQQDPLRVYVNPDIYEPDEWECPPDSGQILKHLSPDIKLRIGELPSPSDLAWLLCADQPEVQPFGPSPSE